MDTSKPIVNKVAQKAIITLNLEDYFPLESEVTAIDMANFLFKGLILREGDFRQAVAETDWPAYKDKYVAIHCSANAIIPLWAYMVLSAELAPYAKDIAASSPAHAPEIFLYRNLAKLDMEPFAGQRVVVKGCGERQVPEAAFVQITKQLTPVARVIMYGEPCSTVPVFKKSVQ
ncbi:MAG TPA: DUF2480 family protein [Chitinophagales bacterium]|nr:DUF2480 family protein [Chitinophagales bacterium]